VIEIALPTPPIRFRGQGFLSRSCVMIRLSPEEEAEECRRKALAYLGRPEAPFLMRVAREFDRLAAKRGNETHRRA
jgi:hypothetical protein